MNATSSGVAFSAAKIRSPSFSRSSSSMTTTALPAAMSAIARSTESSLVIVAITASGRPCVGGPSNRSTYLAMTSTSRLTGVPTAALPSVVSCSVVGISDDLEPVLAEPRHRQGDPVDGDRALLDDVAGHGGGQRDPHHLPVLRRRPREHVPGAVDVALHDVAPEPAVERGGPLEVDLAAHADRGEAGPVERLGHDVGAEGTVGEHVDDGQTHAVDRDGVAVAGVGGDDAGRGSRTGPRRPGPPCRRSHPTLRRCR